MKLTGNRLSVARLEKPLASRAVQKDLVALLPNLRAFAIALSGDHDRADDLVQETVLKAWSHLDSFTEGTNLRAWLFTILRNTFLSDLRSRRHEVPLDVEVLATAPDQYSRCEGNEMRRALNELNPEQRSAIILVGAEGFTYEEAAVICGCAIGTIKSRVHRARHHLLKRLGADIPVVGAVEQPTLRDHEQRECV